jgi:hypothetical protein
LVDSSASNPIISFLAHLKRFNMVFTKSSPKADLMWRRLVAHRRTELDLLPLWKDHLHVRVIAQVGQGGGLKVSS